MATQMIDGLPFGIAVGNHDQAPAGDPDGPTTILFNQYFGAERFLGRAYYGGHHGNNNDNHFQLFSASDMDFIVVHLEYDKEASPVVLDLLARLRDQGLSVEGLSVSEPSLEDVFVRLTGDELEQRSSGSNGTDGSAGIVQPELVTAGGS